MSYDSSQHPVFYNPSVCAFCNTRENVSHPCRTVYKNICFYILIFTFKFSEGVSQYHSQTVASITIIAPYLSAFRESSCGFLMSSKTNVLAITFFFFVNSVKVYVANV